MSRNATDKLPSQAGRKVLLNLHGGRNSAHGLQAGGLVATLTSLRRRGLIDHRYTLTEAGRAMVRRLTVAPEVKHAA